MPQNRKPIPKTQQQLANEQVTPTYQQSGNPNNFIQTPQNNRALNTSFKDDTVKPFSVGIQDIDEAVFYYFQNVIQPSVTQNSQRLPVPIIYGSPEKWKSFQKDGFYRDLNNKIMAPLIMFKKNNIEKNRNLTNKLDANNPHNIAITGQTYSKQNAYSKFNILNGIKPEQTYYASVVPDYLTITYDCIIFTYYVDQLNKIIEAVQYASDAYWGDPERFKFRAHIDSFPMTTELTENNERSVRSAFTIKLFGYIVPDVAQKAATFVGKFSNRNKLIVTNESTTNIDDLKNNPNI
jgi:hypothetical protein